MRSISLDLSNVIFRFRMGTFVATYIHSLNNPQKVLAVNRVISNSKGTIVKPCLFR